MPLRTPYIDSISMCDWSIAGVRIMDVQATIGIGTRTHRFVQAHDPSDSLLFEEWNIVMGPECAIHTLLSVAACGATEC